MEKARHVAAARGLKVLECTSAGAGDRSQGPLLHLTWTRPAEFDTVTFAQDLATLMEAGLMVKESVAALARKETSTGRKQILTRLNDTMAEGLRFSAALERAGVFPPLLVATWRPARRREICPLGCVSPQTVHAYEGRMPPHPGGSPAGGGAHAQGFARRLFGESKQAARAKRGPASKLEHHLERIGSLPKPRQRAVIDVIDVIEAMLAQQGH
jgi:hypothetical protein